MLNIIIIFTITTFALFAARKLYMLWYDRKCEKDLRKWLEEIKRQK